ncbi:MAG: sigma-70 family RNA polymerase sigma factor [Myxococcales bacterium]|nr:sigma-70 family RNA polymerase sigma factor [Myxococcales bacterium]
MSVSERLLLARLRERDEEAFSQVVRLYGDRVFNLVARLVGNRSEAEDIAQEVFVTVFKSIETFRGESKFSTWLLRIAANHAKNRIKYLARRPGVGGEQADDELPSNQPRSLQAHVASPDALMEAAELGSLLERAIAELDEEHRLLLVLRDVEELAYEEICEITGLPEGTVKSRLHRARLTLKALIERHTK